MSCQSMECLRVNPPTAIPMIVSDQTSTSTPHRCPFFPPPPRTSTMPFDLINVVNHFEDTLQIHFLSRCSLADPFERTNLCLINFPSTSHFGSGERRKGWEINAKVEVA